MLFLLRLIYDLPVLPTLGDVGYTPPDPLDEAHPTVNGLELLSRRVARPRGFEPAVLAAWQAFVATQEAWVGDGAASEVVEWGRCRLENGHVVRSREHERAQPFPSTWAADTSLLRSRAQSSNRLARFVKFMAVDGLERVAEVISLSAIVVNAERMHMAYLSCFPLTRVHFGIAEEFDRRGTRQDMVVPVSHLRCLVRLTLSPPRADGTEWVGVGWKHSSQVCEW